MAAIPPNLPTEPEISLSPPRPFSHPLYPLREDHVYDLHNNSESGTKLPTDVESLTSEHNIHPTLAQQHRSHLEDLAAVYSTAKEHSTTYRGRTRESIADLNQDIIRLSEEFETFYPKLRNYTHYYHSRNAVDITIEGLIFTLSSLILKAAHIADIVVETHKSIQYGQHHVSRVHDKTSSLLQSTSFKDDLDNLGDAAPLTIATMLTVQGGFGRLLVNLTTIKNKVDSGIFDPHKLFENQSVEDVVNAWKNVKEKAVAFSKDFE